MRHSLVRLIDGTSKAFAILSVALLIVAMVVVCQMIFLRYVFRAPTIWQTDFVVYSATAAIFFGAPYVLLTKGHVGVDVIDNIASPPVRRVLHRIGDVLGLVFCLAMAVASAMHVVEALEGGWETSGVWQIPYWIPAIPLPIGFGLLCLQYLADFARPRGYEGGDRP